MRDVLKFDDKKRLVVVFVLGFVSAMLLSDKFYDLSWVVLRNAAHLCG